MRYPDGGGLTAAGRVRREKVRLQAAEWFAEGVEPPEVARRLRVSCFRVGRVSYSYMLFDASSTQVFGGGNSYRN